MIHFRPKGFKKITFKITVLHLIPDNFLYRPHMVILSKMIKFSLLCEKYVNRIYILKRSRAYRHSIGVLFVSKEYSCKFNLVIKSISID